MLGRPAEGRVEDGLDATWTVTDEQEGGGPAVSTRPDECWWLFGDNGQTGRQELENTKVRFGTWNVGRGGCALFGEHRSALW